MAQFTIEDYLNRSGAGESSLRTYRKLLTRCETWLGKPLSAATDRDLGKLKMRLRRMRSGRNYVAEMRRFYKTADRPDLAAICILKQRVRRLAPEDILTLPEVQAMISAANSLRDRALLVMLWVGQRVTATAHLRLGDIKEKVSDNGGGAYRISYRDVKIAGQEHVGWLLEKEGASHVRSWLGAYEGAPVADDSPLFPSFTKGQGRALEESAVLKIVQRCAKRAGITKRVYPHLFRHSRATFLLQHHVPDAMIEKLMGWAPGSGMLSRRYGHLSSEDSLNALLRAHGIAVEETDEEIVIIPSESDLLPVVPRMPPPGTKSPETVTLSEDEADTLALVRELITGEFKTEKGTVGDYLQRFFAERIAARKASEDKSQTRLPLQ